MSQEYEMPGPSPRERVALAIADWIASHGMSQDFRGEGVAERRTFGSRSFWRVLFSKSVVLDGDVEIYSEGWIKVRWLSSMAGDVPPQDSVVFGCQEHAIQFLDLMFLQDKVAEALALPRYQKKGRVRRGEHNGPSEASQGSTGVSEGDWDASDFV